MDLIEVLLLVVAIAVFTCATLLMNARVNLIALGLLLVTIYLLLASSAWDALTN